MSLLLRGVSYRYAGAATAALRGIDLEIARGEVLGVVGANESGKSTLCAVAAGLAPAAIGGHLEGLVSADGLDTRTARSWELAQVCGCLFQNPASGLSGTAPTVWEEVAFGPRNLGLPLADIVDRVEAALAAVAVTALAARDPARLSGGEAQLVALAGVLALRPAYLVLDEPTSELDPRGTGMVADAIAELAGTTDTGVVIVEHKTEILERVADRVAVLDDGALRLVGGIRTVFEDPDLVGWGINPPPRVELEAAVAAAGLILPEEPDAG